MTKVYNCRTTSKNGILQNLKKKIFQSVLMLQSRNQHWHGKTYELKRISHNISLLHLQGYIINYLHVHYHPGVGNHGWNPTNQKSAFATIQG